MTCPFSFFLQSRPIKPPEIEAPEILPEKPTPDPDPPADQVAVEPKIVPDRLPDEPSLDCQEPDKTPLVSMNVALHAPTSPLHFVGLVTLQPPVHDPAMMLAVGSA